MQILLILLISTFENSEDVILYIKYLFFESQLDIWTLINLQHFLDLGRCGTQLLPEVISCLGGRTSFR